jgi:hypothetical protein
MTITGILLKASLLLFAAVLTHVLIGKRVSAASRHLLWTLAISALLILPASSPCSSDHFGVQGIFCKVVEMSHDACRTSPCR